MAGSRTFVGVAAGLVVIALSGAAPSSAARADTRSLTFFNTHTSERSTVVFKRDGVYDQAGLKQLNFVLRDWRRNEQVRMDPELFDLVWEVYRDSGASEPIQIICGYRAPETNSMLRNRSRGVAKHSQHVLGKALDFNIPGVDLTKLRYTGMKKQFGGVGIYYGSNFVHMDVGSVRTWPNRLSRDQLLALFPDGRTLHLPADGKPLAGYDVAMADFRKNHPNRGAASAGDEDEAPTPMVAQSVATQSVATQPVAVAALDTRPAPGPSAAASAVPVRPVAEPRASSVRVEDGANLTAFAGAVPPVKPQTEAASAPSTPAASTPPPSTIVASLAGPFALPRPKPVAETKSVMEAKPVAEPRLAYVGTARPSPSAVDALALLTGEPDDSADALGYAPPPAARIGGDRATLDRLAGEPVDTVASIGGGKVILAALPPADSALPRGDGARPAAKADRGDPLARLVAPGAQRPDPRLYVIASLARPADRADPLIRGAQDGLTTLLVKPRQVIIAGFRPGGPGTFSSFYGPAVAAVPMRSFE